MATRENLERAFDDWARAVKAAQLEPVEQLILNRHIAAQLRGMPSPDSNKAGQPALLSVLADELDR